MVGWPTPPGFCRFRKEFLSRHGATTARLQPPILHIGLGIEPSLLSIPVPRSILSLPNTITVRLRAGEGWFLSLRTCRILFPELNSISFGKLYAHLLPRPPNPSLIFRRSFSKTTIRSPPHHVVEQQQQLLLFPAKGTTSHTAKLGSR